MFKKITREMPCTEKFLQWLLPRGIVVMLAIVVSLFFVGYAPRVETGIVEYKIVTGSNGQGWHVLMLETDTVTLLLANEIRDCMLRDSNLLKADERLEDELARFYTDIQYRISVRLSGTDRANIFSVPRDVFDAIRTNELVSFEIEKPYSNRINRMINRLTENTSSAVSHFPEYSGLRHYMNQ